MAEKDHSGGGGIRNKVHNILMRSKYPQPEIGFELDDSDKMDCTCETGKILDNS